MFCLQAAQNKNKTVNKESKHKENKEKQRDKSNESSEKDKPEPASEKSGKKKGEVLGFVLSISARPFCNWSYRVFYLTVRQEEEGREEAGEKRKAKICSKGKGA